MERDPLQEFIRENRESFETSFDAEKNWQKLQEKRNSARRAPATPTAGRSLNLSWLKIAAMMIFVSGLTYIIVNNDNGGGAATVNNHYHLSLSDLSPELAEVEQHYASNIEQKMQQVKNMDVDQELLNELTLIDNERAMLDDEMQNAVNNEKIVKAIIKNYRMKLNLLEEMMEDINKAKNKSNDRKTKVIEL